MRNNEFKLHIWRSDILTSLFDNNFSAELVENMNVRAEIHGPEPAKIWQTKTTNLQTSNRQNSKDQFEPFGRSVDP